MPRRTSPQDANRGPGGSDPFFPHAAATTENRDGQAPVTLLCDHASNNVPDAFASLGLSAAQLESHVAFDPGAAALTREVARHLDAALVLGGYSRLLIDVNRDPSDLDSIVQENDGIRVPGNEKLSEADRAARVEAIYEPYHAAVDELLTARASRDENQLVVSVHSFTPWFAGRQRPWELGVIHGQDRRLAGGLAAGIVERSDYNRLTLGLNEPYSPTDRVYHTLERHAEQRDLPCAMVELPNDKLLDPDQRQVWAERLADAVRASVEALVPGHS